MFISSIDNSVYSLSLDICNNAAWDCISVHILRKSKSRGRASIDHPTINEYYKSDIELESYNSIIKKVKRTQDDTFV